MKTALKALKKANRFRERKVFDDKLVDLSSNDYLGLSSNKEIFEKTVKHLKHLKYHAPKSSMLVGGYSQTHKKLEELLCKLNGFEAGIVVGSGFLANLALIEALCRQDTLLLLDEESHASALLASKLVKGDVEIFAHNDANALDAALKTSKHKERYVFVEGIYSMSGDLLNREIVEIANAYDAYLIVDEAHSSGVVGDNLLGIFDLYDISSNEKHIKMGTFGKAYGSYGAYILGSKTVISFLENRAKPVIYSTALSLFDTEYAYNAIITIQKNLSYFRKKIKNRQALAQKEFHAIDGLILSIEIGDNAKVVEIANKLLKDGYSVGAIREPTVKKAILRVNLRVGVKMELIGKVLDRIKFIC